LKHAVSSPRTQADNLSLKGADAILLEDKTRNRNPTRVGALAMLRKKTTCLELYEVDKMLKTMNQDVI
jgi:hypothetical protein